MPLPITFDWSEDENTIQFVLHVRGVKAKHVDIALCDVYIKVNCHPSFFEADLLHEINPDDPKTHCRVGTDKVSLSLRKRESGIWHQFRATGSKAELRARRQKALEAAQERENERQKRKSEWKQDMLKAGEHEQWRLDRENREQIEKWEQEEKAKWEQDVYASFDEETRASLGPAELPPRDDEDLGKPQSMASAEAALRQGETRASQLPEGLARTKGSQEDDGPVPRVCEVTDEEAERIRARGAAGAAPWGSAAETAGARDAQAIWTDEDLDDTEEYVPAVRENPGKVGVRFTERPRPGVPVRDRGQRPPPLPKDAVKSDHAPPMLAGDEPADESDPVWLKDKADSLMVIGDYQGAYNAYTEALKIASNAKAFANRAVADLFLGNLDQCVEDCNNSLRILDLRRRTKEGYMPGPADPEDEKVRARVEVRIGTAYLWLGAFGKAESHFTKAIDLEDGLEIEERRKVKEDLIRIQHAKAALSIKEKADSAARRARTDALSEALGLYEEAVGADPESVAVLANRCFAHLRASQLRECLADGEAALQCLKMWPMAAQPPEKPARPSRLEPPYIDDPTFKHPDQQKQGEVDWLMKHSGGTVKDLPPLPVEYEWVKDAAEKNDNAWIAVRKKMPKATIDAIRRATVQLQDTLYSRKPFLIREQVQVAIEQNKAGEGPSAKAIRQSEEYADKLEEHERERQLEQERREQDLQREIEACSLEELLAPARSGAARAGLGRGHPAQRTRRRLFAKVLLRRAWALELLGEVQAAAAELRTVLQVEPDNPEARQRLATVEAVLTQATPAVEATQQPIAAAPLATPIEAATAVAEKPPVSVDVQAVQSAQSVACAEATLRSQTSEVEANFGGKDSVHDSAVDDDVETADDRVDHSATATLLKSATEYIRRNDFASALQIYNYARRSCKVWESPMEELKVLSNISLCLQRIRGRLPELISACNEAIARIEELREEGGNEVSEELLLRMECACLSRRGSAYAQQKQMEESSRDAVRVRELLARVGEVEVGHHPAPAG